MKETAMNAEKINLCSEKSPQLSTRAGILGKILQKYPKLQSNSPELYVLSYLDNLGSHKI
jgi:hypothetical protein